MPDAQGRMIVDCHTHLMWYPDHVGQQYAEEALASKLIKLKYSGGEAYSANLELHSYDSKPDTHWESLNLPTGWSSSVARQRQSESGFRMRSSPITANSIRTKWKAGRRSIRVNQTTWNNSIIA